MVELMISLIVKEAYRWLDFFQLQTYSCTADSSFSSFHLIQHPNLLPILKPYLFHHELCNAISFLNLNILFCMIDK